MLDAQSMRRCRGVRPLNRVFHPLLRGEQIIARWAVGGSQGGLRNQRTQLGKRDLSSLRRFIIVKDCQFQLNFGALIAAPRG
jgi:hypothetical protein